MPSRFAPALSASAFAARFAPSQAVTLVLVFAAFTHAGPLAAAWVTAARSVPGILAPAVAGWFYDRVSPRRLVVAVGAAEASAVAVSVWVMPSAAWAVVLLAAVLGSSLAVFDTTLTAGLKDAGSSALASSVLTGLAFDVGKLLAAALAWWYSSSWALAAVTMVALDVAGVCALAWRSSPEGAASRQQGRVWGSWMLPLVPALPALALLNGSTGCLLFWQAAAARGSASAFAVVNACLAVGAIAGNVVLARAGLSRLSTRAGVVVSAVGLVSLAAFGPFGWVPLAVSAVVWGLGVAWWFQALRGWLVGSAPEGFRGRAGSVLVVSARLSLSLGAVGMSLLVQAWGPATAAVVAGLLAVAAAVVLPRKVAWPSPGAATGPSLQ